MKGNHLTLYKTMNNWLLIPFLLKNDRKFQFFFWLSRPFEVWKLTIKLSHSPKKKKKKLDQNTRIFCPNKHTHTSKKIFNITKGGQTIENWHQNVRKVNTNVINQKMDKKCRSFTNTKNFREKCVFVLCYILSPHSKLIWNFKSRYDEIPTKNVLEEESLNLNNCLINSR